MVWSTSPELAAAYKALGNEALVHLVNCGFYASEIELDAFNRSLLATKTEGIQVDPSVLEDAAKRCMRAMATEDLSSMPLQVTAIDEKSVASFPLKLTHAESYLGDRTVLVGDAAHTIHPIAGQGLNMGLADVRSLANVWEETVRRGGDVGGSRALLRYGCHLPDSDVFLLFCQAPTRQCSDTLASVIQPII
jgi:ubiquinone biosynthesis monooxygenase Coq6